MKGSCHLLNFSSNHKASCFPRNWENWKDAEQILEKNPENICPFSTRQKQLEFGFYPPASEASREVANLTERKNPPTLVYGVKEFVNIFTVTLNVIILLFKPAILVGNFACGGAGTE